MYKWGFMTYISSQQANFFVSHYMTTIISFQTMSSGSMISILSGHNYPVYKPPPLFYIDKHVI